MQAGGEEVTARLRDGSEVTVRPIRASDREMIRRGFERLSDDSRYKRFLTPMSRLTDAQLAYLTVVDHHDHEALIAFETATGDGVGVARFVREPGRPGAEAAVTVIDDWQGRGLGTLLTELLARRAREEGVTSFWALLLARNREMLDLFEAVGSTRVTERSGGAIEVEVPLEAQGEDAGPDEPARGLLRAVASTPLYLVTAPGQASREAGDG